MSGNIYQQGLAKNAANFVPLSPLSFIERTASVYPQRTSVIHGSREFTWSETYTRCRRLASALAARGIGVGDTVAVMLPNVPAMFEVHFGVPMLGAVLNTLNTRLDPEAIAFMLAHGEAKVLITDPEFAAIVAPALEKLEGPKPLVIDVLDPEYPIRSTRAAIGSVRSSTRNSSPPAMPSSNGPCRPTSGTRSHSTTRPARPATPRGWSITTVARI